MFLNKKINLKKYFFYSWKINFTEIEITYVRVLVYLIILYKILSRDFSNFGYIPEELLNFYPINHYTQDIRNLSGIKVIIDLATFHWIHWFINFPSVETLNYIQFTLVFLILIVIFFGSGKKNFFSILVYIFLVYLWGFMYRTSTDFEGTQLVLQICLLFCFFDTGGKVLFFSSEKNRKNLIYQQKSRNAFFFLLTLLVSIYYFSSGLHKLYDLSFTQWFQYDLTQAISMFLDQIQLGNFRSVPKIFSIIPESNFLNYLGVIFIYLSHLFAFLMIVRRDTIKNFIYIYTIFHFTVYGVGINFFGNVLVLLLFIPFNYFFEKIKINNITSNQQYYLLKKIFKNKINLSDCKINIDDKNYITINTKNKVYTNLFAIRRLLWLNPILWIINFILYIPIFNLKIFGQKYEISEFKKSNHL